MLRTWCSLWRRRSGRLRQLPLRSGQMQVSPFTGSERPPGTSKKKASVPLPCAGSVQLTRRRTGARAADWMDKHAFSKLWYQCPLTVIWAKCDDHCFLIWSHALCTTVAVLVECKKWDYQCKLGVRFWEILFLTCVKICFRAYFDRSHRNIYILIRGWISCNVRSLVLLSFRYSPYVKIE